MQVVHVFICQGLNSHLYHYCSVHTDMCVHTYPHRSIVQSETYKAYIPRLPATKQWSLCKILYTLHSTLKQCFPQKQNVIYAVTLDSCLSSSEILFRSCSISCPDDGAMSLMAEGADLENTSFPSGSLYRANICQAK